MPDPKPKSPAQRLEKLALFPDLGYQPHSGQLLVHRSKAKRRVLACGSRWGKSLAASMEACAALLEPRDQALGWLVAPTRDLVDRIFLRVVDTLKARMPHRVLELDLRIQRIVVCNLDGGRSELRGKSADMPVTLLGEALDFLVVDEAARLRGEIWESYLSQRLVDRGGWALFVSTPSGPGWFHQLYRRGIRNRDPDCESWSCPSWANPHLDRTLIDAERERLPSGTFAEQYGGEFQGVEAEPCESCSPPSPRACCVLHEDQHEPLPRCPACGVPVDEQGRSLIPKGANFVRMLVRDHGDYGTIEDPSPPAATKPLVPVAGPLVPEIP